VANSEHLEPTFTAEAIALVKAIDALAANKEPWQRSTKPLRVIS
jgi:hypothetical protein